MRKIRQKYRFPSHLSKKYSQCKLDLYLYIAIECLLPVTYQY